MKKNERGTETKKRDRAGIRGRDEARVGEKRNIRETKKQLKGKKKRARKGIRSSAER